MRAPSMPLLHPDPARMPAVTCIAATAHDTPGRLEAAGADVTRAARRLRQNPVPIGSRRRGRNPCAGCPPLRERNRERLRPAVVRYAAWNAAISAAADWRETVADAASGAS